MLQLDTNYPQIEKLKNQIINLTLILGTAVGIIVYFLSLTRWSISGFELSFLTDFIVLFVLLVITLYRNKLSISIKSYIAIAAIYILVMVDTYKLGIFSADKVLIVLIPFLSLLTLSIFRAITLFFFTIISFFVLAYLHLSGFLVAPSQDDIKLSAWLINILLIIIVAIVVVIIQARFNLMYTNLIAELEESNKIVSEKERNYREIFNASTDAIFIHDMEGKVLDVNESMLKMYNYSYEDISTISIADLSSQKAGYTSVEAVEFVKKAVKGGIQVFDWQAKTKDGNFFWAEVALKKAQIGTNERILAIVRDITEKKEDALQLALYRNHLKEMVDKKTVELEKSNEALKITNEELFDKNEIINQQNTELKTTLTYLKETQTQLLQAEKMASLGILTAGVAHEINNPLNYIMGAYVGLERIMEEKSFEENTEIIKFLLDSIKTGIDRASSIVTGLNQFSRNNKSLDEDCNLHVILDNSLSMLNNQIKHRITIDKKYFASDIIIKGNVGNLHQVFLNIFGNAIYAIENKGTIQIKTMLSDLKVEINISDTGEGISPENLKKITDPFFTTKDPGKGTGLGLSITYNIVKEHNGSLDFISNPGKGTTVSIKLPYSQ